MRRLTLEGTDISVSRLSFGTASLHHISTSRRRQDLLAAAFDNGFSHFDTAPYYGFGIAEDELGRFLKGRGGRVTVATKVGLYSPGGSHGNMISVWARKLAGKVLPSLSRPVANWSIARAAESLEISLRRLRIDHVDLLLLHEPEASAVQSEAFLEWLREQKGKGRVGAWGLAGEADRIESWLSIDHPLAMVLQVRDSLERREADLVRKRRREPQITYGYLSSLASSLQGRDAMGTLEKALRRKTAGSILVSTRKIERIGELAAVAARDDGDAD